MVQLMSQVNTSQEGQYGTSCVIVDKNKLITILKDLEYVKKRLDAFLK